MNSPPPSGARVKVIDTLRDATNSLGMILIIRPQVVRDTV